MDQKKASWNGVNVFSLLANTDTGLEIYLSDCEDFMKCFFIDKYNFRVNLKKIYEMTEKRKKDNEWNKRRILS